MLDVINAFVQNDDGSWAFNVTYHDGAGVAGDTVVVVPGPGDGTLPTAQAELAPLATAQRDQWIAAASLTPNPNPVSFT